MLYELYDIEISPVAASIWLGLGLGVIFGIAAQISRFCLRRGLVGQGTDRRAALGVWLAGLAAAIAGTQVAAGLGYLDLSEHRFAATELPWLAIVVGGLLFGAGMVLTRGCISRLTVLSGTGNLRALSVIIVFAIVAHATLKGLLAPLRTTLGGTTVDVGPLATASGLPGGAALWAAVAVVGLAFLVARSGARLTHIALGIVVGLLVPLGWFGTGTFLLDDFDPLPLASLSFTAPWADTLFWSIASTAIPAGFGTGLIGGVFLGSFASAAARRELRLESFSSPQQTLRYTAGAALMGVGGVLAGGCTVGAGLSGVAGLNLSAALALVAIMVGAKATDLVLQGNAAGTGAAVPAE